MGFDLGSLLQQYMGGASAPADQAEAHFDQASQSASPDLLRTGLAAMFRSDATPPFGQMAGELFGQANPNQQAGMLNQLIAGMGPAVLASLMNKFGSGAGGSQSGGALGGLGGLLGQLTGSGTPALTPDQASQLTPEQVQVIANHAEKANPGIIDQMSAFYAEHPTLVKTVGSAALGIALAKMAQHRNA